MIRELHIYDFDATLFMSPMHPDDWEGHIGHWYDTLKSLSAPCVIDPPDDLWIESTVQDALASIANPEVYTILMTGRSLRDDLLQRIMELIAMRGLQFDEVHLKPDGETLPWKSSMIEEFVSRIPGVEVVQIWEDRQGHLQAFVELIESLGLEAVPHFVNVVLNAPCDLSSEKVPIEPGIVMELSELMLRSYVRELLFEGSLTGNKLENVARIVADEVIDYLKDPDLRDAFVTQGALGFKLELELPEAILWLRDIFVNVRPSEGFNSDARYEFTLDADDAQRQESDMQFNLYMPQDYTDEELEKLKIEIEADARHELEHSGQLTSVLMDVQQKMPGGQIWRSLQTAEDYYTSEAEVPAHVASLVLKSKRLEGHAADVVDDELYRIYATGLDNGYSEEELNPLMAHMRGIWQYYLMGRWPEQEWPIEFRPEGE